MVTRVLHIATVDSKSRQTFLGVRGENGRGVFVTEAAPAIARREREGETLRAFEAALRAALASGHSHETLRAALDAAVAPTARKSA